MKMTPEGMLFDDVYELTYYVLEELGLQLLPDGRLFDEVKNEILSFNGMIIKGSVNPNKINYAGQGEITLDLLNNVRLTTVLFGRFLQNKMAEGMPFVSQYTEEYVDDTEVKFNRLVVKHDTYNQTVSRYYHNKCLKFIDMIFLLDDDNVELRNFDTTIDDEI
jgi:hypothetical protein